MTLSVPKFEDTKGVPNTRHAL